MIALIYLKEAMAWTWRTLRAWSAVGHRLGRIEETLQEHAVGHEEDVKQLEGVITATSESQKSAIAQVEQRLEDLERRQSLELGKLDRTLQNRVDEWARQLSGQMNQLYLAVTRDPVQVRRE